MTERAREAMVAITQWLSLNSKYRWSSEIPRLTNGVIWHVTLDYDRWETGRAFRDLDAMTKEGAEAFAEELATRHEFYRVQTRKTY